MWPSSSSIFRGRPCPLGSSCDFPHCLFSHEQSKISTQRPATAPGEPQIIGEPPAKRLRFDHVAEQPGAQPGKDMSLATEPSVFTGLRASKPTLISREQDTSMSYSGGQSPNNDKKGNALPRTATRPVSPPPKKADTETKPEPEVEISLLPRKVQHDPVAFKSRVTRLRSLHQYMVPLNNKVATAVKPSTKALHLSANQLKKLAIDEEEQIARENGSAYENVIRHRMAAYRKMSIDEWVKARREAVAKQNGEPPKKPPPKNVETGMTLKEEVIFLSTLLASKESLEAHGFVMKKPSDLEIEECRKTQETADFWEVCERCGTRFQVFPERRESDGALTTGGKCRHHWGKKFWPKRVKGQESQPAQYSCCNEPVGSSGCTVHDTHVYKFTDVKRMSAVMPFIETPDNDKAEPQTAVCFDCEMGYTTHGFELLRLTAVSWPSHKPIIDVLVRPLGSILDLNTRWSGVTMDQFLNAKPYDPANPKPRRTDLRIVESPYVARDLFLAHISPTTPVLGHALENDLNVIRLIHPTIVDTVLLYPTQSGLPYRPALRTLARQHLDIDIQQGGAAGHDSYEDARTTGELIRLKVRQEWRKLKEQGWTIRDGTVNPPLPPGPPPPFAPAVPSMIATPKLANANGSQTAKRKLDDQEEDGLETPLLKK